MNWTNIDIGAFLDDPTADRVRDAFEDVNNGNTYLFPLVNDGTKVREVIRGFSTTSGTLPANAVASINAGNQFTIPANQLGIVTFLQSNNPPSPLPPTSDLGYTKFSFIIETGAGTYGSGATTLIEQNLIQLAPVNVGIEPSQLFELGNIGTATIETYVNGSGAYFINGIAVFTATQVIDGDSFDKQWLFIGGDGNWGDGATATTADMFVDLATQGGDNPNPNNLPNDVISGREVIWTGTGLVFIITQGVIRFNGVEFSKAEQTVTLAASDPTNDRFDTFFDEIVDAGAITGTPAINPIQPQVDPLTQIRLTSVLIEATATTPVEVVDEPIYLENEQPPEYTGSSTGVGVVNFNSADDPFEGVKCISVLGVQNLKRVIMTRDTDVDFATFETLSIALRQAAIIGQATKERLFIGLLDSSDNELIVPVQVPLEFNLNWQVIGFAMDAFKWYGATTGRKVYIEYRSVSANKAQGFFIDNWRLQGGISQPTPINDQTPPVHREYTTQALMIADQLEQKKNWLYFDGTQYWEYLGTVLGTIADYRSANEGVTVPTMQEIFDAAADDVIVEGYGLFTITDTPAQENASSWDYSGFLTWGDESSGGLKEVLINPHRVFFKDFVANTSIALRVSDTPESGGAQGGTIWIPSLDSANSETMATREWVTGEIPATPTEEEIIGTAIEDAAVTGTYNLDLSTFSDALLNLTGNTTITVSNTPSADKSFVKTLEITSAVAETLTLPIAWVVIGTYDPAEINYLTIKFSNYTTAGEKVLVEITQ